MDGRRIDNLARLAATTSRRQATRFVVGATAAGVASALSSRVWPQGFGRARSAYAGVPAALTISCADCVGLCEVAKPAAQSGGKSACKAAVVLVPQCKLLKWVCKPVAGAICGAVLGRLDLSCDASCASGPLESAFDVIGYVPGVSFDNCPDPCESGTEPCAGADPGNPVCVPSCPGGQILDQASCACPDACPAGTQACTLADPNNALCVAICPSDQILNQTTCQCEGHPAAIEPTGPEAGPVELYDDTGVGLTKRWQFIVPEGQVLIVGGYAAIVNGESVGIRGVLIAYETLTPVDMTVTDGFYKLASEASAQAEFCQRLNQAIQMGWAHDAVVLPPQWGQDPCTTSDDLPDNEVGPRATVVEEPPDVEETPVVGGAGCPETAQVPLYDDTGVNATESWQFMVPGGYVLIVGGYSAVVNGQSYGNSGLLAAFPACTLVDLSITDGFYKLAQEGAARGEFCQRLAQAEANGWAHDVVIGLPDWGSPPC